MRFARDVCGLVVDDRKPAIAEPVDAVGLGAKGEIAGGSGEDQASADLGRQRRSTFAPGYFIVDEPRRDALETRPPEGHDAGGLREAPEFFAPERKQPRQRRGTEGVRKFGDEAVENFVNDGALVGGAGVGVDIVERPQAEDMAGINGVRIAQPGFDLGDGEAARAGIERRAWRRRAGRLRRRLRRVEHFLPSEPAPRFLLDKGVELAGREHGFEARQPARGHRRLALDAPGAGQHDLRRGAALGEIMG